MATKTSLNSISTFPELLDYLRDELDWPVEEASFDELTFDYMNRPGFVGGSNS